MAHPFEKMFLTALKKSQSGENEVLHCAQNLIAKGYSESEVMTVLDDLGKGLIDPVEAEVVKAAYEEIESGGVDQY